MNTIDISNIDFKNFSYDYELFRDEAQLELWITAGHTIENTKIGIFQVANTQKYKFITDQFPHLKNIGICFHVLQPGNYLPEHQDRYGFYSKKFNIENLNNICRTVVFLESSKRGHFLTVDDKVYSLWNAGDTVSWSGTTPHSAINLGLEPRYTMQITGTYVS